MMNQPSLEELREQVDSRYTLVVAVAKRARQLLDGAKAQVEVDSAKPVTVALHELAQGKIHYERTRSGIK